MRQYGQFRHSFLSGDFVKFAAGQRGADAAVHAARGELIGRGRQRLDRGLHRVHVLRLLGAAGRLQAFIDPLAFLGIQQVAVDRQRGLHRFDQLARFHLLLAQHAGAGIVVCLRHAVGQHARDFVIAQAIRRLDRHRRFHARALLARGHAQQAVGVHLERHADARGARHHRRNAAQFETRQRTAIRHQVALALQHVDAHGRLAILERREFLRARHRNGAVARNHALDQPAHGFQAERQRRHIQQQPVLARRAVAGQQIGLQRGAQRHDLIRIQIGQRLGAEHLADRGAHHRHARGATHHHHAAHVGRLEGGVAQRQARAVQRALHQRLRQRLELRAGQRVIDHLAIGQRQRQMGVLRIRQRFAGRAGRHQQATPVGMRQFGGARGRHHVVDDERIEIIAAQRGIAAGRDHFEHALRQPQNGNIESAATQVIDGVHAFGGVIQAVGDRRGGRLVQQAQHVQAGQARRVAGRLALGVVEIGRDRDDGAHQVVAQHVLGALAQHRQDLRRHFHRAQVALRGTDAHHAGRIHEFVGRARGPRLFQRTAHETLDRHHRVQRVLGLLRQGFAARRDLAAREITHRRGQQHVALRIGQDFGNAAAHRGNQGIGGAQVDPHRQLALVRRGRFTGLGYLQ
ncbi:putative NAD-specific glutamate dehydrogenase [Achromobacter insuavis AXX-A]|uniref:Putative NAD-specific glutamate dehydrogenase n=1 Tax=Achromobacter insuavis AXX-A TaxID=1003200 RepID=F7TA50_9BURK|nr:putative NAD-specific glutamate dehydrogenase [Achromobacter insuavis AXX-A]